jgi:hypothetical protein
MLTKSEDPMRNGLICLTIISLAMTAFACGGTEGTQAAEECSTVTCPTGTAPNMSAEASSSCSGSLSGERGATSVGLSASAECFGSGACTIVCEPVNECCGGESWTTDSYTCETPCGANTCTQVTCPTGTAPALSAGTELSCADGALPSDSSGSAACIGTDECAIVCEPVSQCCGGESWSTDSYTCETPCAAACTCADKCGTVTGPGCTAECGDCTGSQVCLENECVDACPSDVTTCGVGICCDSGTAVCVAGECCDPVKNCTGRQCGDDGCGGDCDDLGDGWGCEPGELCENYQCVVDTDCGGQLPVCELGPDGETTGQIRNCDDDGKWADGPNCVLNELGKNICVQTSAGAVCAVCGDDDDCSEGGSCVIKPGGADCVDCTDDVDCQNSDVGLACKNGTCGCSDAADCPAGQDCVDGACQGEVCDAEAYCDPENGTKRYCGADGCGGFCGDKDWTCNGTGACTAEGQCEPKENFYCKFQPQGDLPPVEIPWSMPFCNSMLPNLSTKAPPYDPNLPGEAVISCNWNAPTEGAPDEYGCVCSLHVEDDQPDGLNCSAQGFLCRSTLEGWDNLNDQNTLDDFECLEPTTCTEYMAELDVEGYVEGERVCNNGYTADYPEGWVVSCEDLNGLPRFRCEDCLDEDGGDDATSPCDDDGIQCYPKDNDEDGVYDSAACEESKAAWCPQEDGTPGTNWQPGCCAADDNGCGGVIEDGQNWDGSGAPGLNPGDDPDLVYDAPQTVKTCVYDAVTNVVRSEAIDCAADGKICQQYALEGSEALIGTCVTPVEPCSNGKIYQRWCNAPGDDFDDTAPEGSVLFCAVNPYVQVKTEQAMSCNEWSNSDPNAEYEAEDPGACHGEPAPEFKLLCVDEMWGAVCRQDRSECCDVITTACEGDQQPQTCAYDPATNGVAVQAVESCPDGELCVDFDYEESGNPETPIVWEAAHCEPIATCPDGTDNQTWCNPPAGEPSHEAAYPEGALVHCNVQQPGNSTSISGQTCTDWGNDGDNGAILNADICGANPTVPGPIPLLEEAQQQWTCQPPDVDSGQAHAFCDQDRSPCCDILTPSCAGNTPTTCAYTAQSNTFEFLPQEPCQVSETCVDFKWDFGEEDLSLGLSDTNDALQVAQAPVCEAVLACPFGATAPGYHDSFCNPPAEAEGHHPDYQTGDAVKCLYFPDSNQLRHMGQGCQAQIETLGGLTIEQQNLMCAEGQLDCCIYTDYICRDVPFDSGDAASDSQALCMLDNSHCCEDFEPRCADANGFVTCEIEEYGSNTYYNESSCDEGDVCVSEKYGDLQFLTDLQSVPVACEPAVSCPENEKGGAKFCNTDGQDGYDEAWGEAIIQCTHWQDTNQIIWTKSNEPGDLCGADEACFPAGDWECEWCKHPTDLDVLGGAALTLSNPSDGTYNTPRCEAPQACPSGFCHPQNGIVSCSHDPISNNLNFSYQSCKDTEACVASAEINDTSVEYHDTLTTEPGSSWYGEFVLSNGVVSIWNNPDTWESRCIPTGCGPEYTQPSSGDEVLQVQCGDPTLFTCYEDTEGEWGALWANFSEDAPTSAWAPELGCLPKTLAAFNSLHVYLTFDGDALVPAPVSKPADESSEPKDNWAVVFCNQSPSDHQYFTNIPGDTDSAPIFVIMGWQELVGSSGIPGPIDAPFAPGNIYANLPGDDATDACSACAHGDDTEALEYALECCLRGHGLDWEGAPNLEECMEKF